LQVWIASGYLRWLHDHSKSRACDSVPTRGQHCANFMFRKNAFAIATQALTTFPNIGHLPNTGITQSASNDEFAYRGIGKWGDTQCSRTLSRVLVVQNAVIQWHCGSSSLKDRVLMHGLSNARSATTPKRWWCRSPTKQMPLLRRYSCRSVRGSASNKPICPPIQTSDAFRCGARAPLNAPAGRRPGR
jgi:hypothetical protein